MKHIITFTNPDGTEIGIDTNAKITIKDTIIGEDAVYGIIYNGAFLSGFNSENNEITFKFEADSFEQILKSTK